MGTIKKYKWVIVLALVVVVLGVAFVVFLFYRDFRTLSDFSAAYKRFDTEQGADTLADLNQKATARISSATQNDPELMSLMREIADLAGKELASLRIEAGLAKDQGNITLQRKAVYARFQELSGIKD